LHDVCLPLGEFAKQDHLAFGQAPAAKRSHGGAVDVQAPALRYHGGKFRLYDWISTFFGPHEVYTEAFGGAAGVLLRKHRSRHEIYNDLDGQVVNFFRVLQDDQQRHALQQKLLKTPYARAEFDLAWEDTKDPIESARRIAIRAQMGFGSAGATKGATGFRGPGVGEPKSYADRWAQYPDSIAAIGERMTGVVIENRPALEILTQNDSPQTLHFVDPPYMRDTRVLKVQNAYRHEMADEEHEQLLDVLRSLKGAVVLCGYPNALYTQSLGGWSLHSTAVRASGHRGNVMRQECVWINPKAQSLLDQRGDLFGPTF